MARYGFVPFFRDWYDDVDRTHYIFDQSFGNGFYEDAEADQAMMVPEPSRVPYSRSVAPPAAYTRTYPPPPPYYMSRMRSGVSSVSNERSKFQIMLDVQQFCPNEIAVKTIDNYIVIEGKHEEKEDEHGYVARHFVRRYLLPKGVKPESVTSTISCDGVLTISAPKESSGSCEIRQIQVTPVNRPVLCSTCPTGQCGLQKSVHEAARTSTSPAPVQQTATSTSPKVQQAPPQQCQPCITVCATTANNQAQMQVSSGPAQKK